ncbi:MAG: CrcB family protein [Deltaproteobacteria bacterium]|nr:CrcB family protein [Deltaproteobacteria bacterium]
MLGGALGSGARHVVGLAADARWGPGFPWGTLGINLAGSFLLGVVLSLSDGGTLSPTARVALGTGVLGGFTTYSTFSAEAVRLLSAGGLAGPSYVAATVIGGLLATAAGFAVGLRFAA